MAEAAGAEGQAPLAATDLACARGERLLFEGLSFEVPAGGLLLVAGPNGSGKSSLLQVAAGLLPPAAGTVRRATRGGEPVRVAYLGHRNALKERLTVRENLGFWARFAGRAGDVDETLERVALAPLAGAPAEWLSAGQRRRLALARVLASGADVWLLDEPEANLDAAGAALVRDSVAAHRGRGGAAVVASPAAMEAEGAQRIALGGT